MVSSRSRRASGLTRTGGLSADVANTTYGLCKLGNRSRKCFKRDAGQYSRNVELPARLDKDDREASNGTRVIIVRSPICTG